MENLKNRLYAEHDSIPHICHIELTYACNENCIFCYNPNRGKLGDINLVDRVVHAVVKSQIPHVYLIGGEPSLLGEEKLNEYIELLSVHSSVTIVTNGLKRLHGISKKLACFGVPLHGANAETHEFLNHTRGSFEKTRETIWAYVDEGHDVRCIPVLTGYNFNQIYDIIALAAELGMESIYIDRYEDGGIGAASSRTKALKPTLAQFGEALDQMIRARRDFPIFEGRVGFGTAIPYCLDERLVSEGMTSDCGVGTYFAAVNSRGDLRICNQSELVFGNIIREPIEIIWGKPGLDIYRDLSWVTEPCRSCDLLLDCTGGCKVDVNCSNEFCIDYAVRGLKTPKGLAKKLKRRELVVEYPERYRIFHPSDYMKLNTCYPEKFLVTRYQTVKLDEIALEMAKAILQKIVTDEMALVKMFAERVGEKEVRVFVSKMVQAGAINLGEGCRMPESGLLDTPSEFAGDIVKLFGDIEKDCIVCVDPDCMGYIWLLKSEVLGLYEAGVPLIEVNKGPTFLHSFRVSDDGKPVFTRKPPCGQLCPDVRRCKIYQIRPFVCKIYPLGLETTAEGKMVWALHRDCHFVRMFEEGGAIVDLMDNLRQILLRLSPKLLAEIVSAYKEVDKLVIYPEGENNYTIVKEVIGHVEMQTSTRQR